MIQRQAWTATAGLLALLLVLAAKGLLIQPPPIASTGFDAARATARLERILGDQRPHPVDCANVSIAAACRNRAW
jgi:hypothetical protein